MCGLWISIGLQPDPQRLARVAHRGPDGSGWRAFDTSAGPVCLGHRRLAIIDTSDAARQPLADADGTRWIVFNGEIYNYVEVRAELAAAGVVFRTASDTEVLLAALTHWGTAALDRLRGMFAFAVFDARAQTLLLARDRFGIKPLYMAATPDGVAFGSEIKQLYDLPGLSRRANLARVRDFLDHGLLDHSRDTMFDGIGQIGPGELVEIDCTTWRPRCAVERRRWYRLPAPASLELAPDVAAARYRERFQSAITEHLRADVAVGSCLSGGLDSSAIVMEASRQRGAGQPMTTVSAVFADTPRVDERRYVEAVRAASGAAAHFVTATPEHVFDLAETAIWYQDEPFGSTSILAQWAVFEAAKRAGVKVMLDGQGADEPLGGYHWLFAPHLADLLRTRQFSAARRQVRARFAMQGVAPARQWRDALAWLLPERLRLKARAARRGLAFTGPALAGLPDVGTGVARGRDGLMLPTLLADLTTATSLPMLLHWEDRNSMAHGIEARVPFLDHRLVELAIALGAEHKLDGGLNKVLLRRALGDTLPRSIVERTDKLGFATPEQEWLTGPLAAAMRARAIETVDAYPALFDRAATLAFIEAAVAGRHPGDFTAWRIVCVGLWLRRFGLSI